MSEEDFLSRWSRRKREAEEAAKTPAANAPARGPVTPEPGREGAPAPAPDAAKATAGEKSGHEQHEPKKSDQRESEEVDLSALPPIESITAETDITAFLRKGVPLELSRAALRRAWIADPTIRDFVGLAENAWDFTDPTAIPGFGPLDQSPEQVRQLAAKIVGEVTRRADAGDAGMEQAPSGKPHELSDLAQRDAAKPQQESTAPAPPDEADAERQIASDETFHRDAAAQNKPSAEFPRRTHGGALPR